MADDSSYLIEKFGKGTARRALYDPATGTYTDLVALAGAEDPRRAFANATSSGDTTVVTPPIGKAVRVLSIYVHSSATVVVKFKSDSTVISSDKKLATNGGFVLPYNPQGWYQTNADEALVINLSALASVGCDITWVPM